MNGSLKTVVRAARDYEYLLCLLRHAEADPAAGGDDSARALTDRGQKQAKWVAKGLVAAWLVPQSIVCSGAVRTRQTVERLVRVFGDAPRVEYRQDLYDKGQSAVMAELAAAEPGLSRLMLVGHEPVISLVTEQLSSPDSDPGLLGQLGMGVSNATVVLLGSHQPFNQWVEHQAALLAILTPADWD